MITVVLLILFSVVLAQPSSQPEPFKGNLQPHLEVHKRQLGQAARSPLRASKKIICQECAKTCWNEARNVSRTWRYCSDTCGCKSVAYY
ncbi:BQ2448_2940 [Microbotryum intermedium]|uniref:BQ2448_2940 protein n=1 Tax=Microbotryum intermedium TaxID=269621 RepID=A0A238FBX7_9BASI|nr:BQ2448_2940 [Microbotryum intermedium]